MPVWKVSYLKNTELKHLKFIVFQCCEMLILTVILKGTMISISHRVHPVIDWFLCDEPSENEMHCFSIVFFFYPKRFFLYK